MTIAEEIQKLEATEVRDAQLRPREFRTPPHVCKRRPLKLFSIDTHTE